jgi:hypothetical protein
MFMVWDRQVSTQVSMAAWGLQEGWRFLVVVMLLIQESCQIARITRSNSSSSSITSRCSSSRGMLRVVQVARPWVAAEVGAEAGGTAVQVQRTAGS